MVDALFRLPPTRFEQAVAQSRITRGGSAMICPTCRMELPDNATACLRCGEPVEQGRVDTRFGIEDDLIERMYGVRSVRKSASHVDHEPTPRPASPTGDRNRSVDQVARGAPSDEAQGRHPSPEEVIVTRIRVPFEDVLVVALQVTVVQFVFGVMAFLILYALLR